MIERKSLIVYFKNKKALDDLGEKVNVAYISNKFNYAVIYADKSLANKLRSQLPNNKGIKSVMDSKVELETF